MPLDDLFELDDVVTSEIVAALVPELRRAEARRARENPVDLDAWSRVNATWLSLQNDLTDKALARKAIDDMQAVLQEDADFALAHAVLAYAHSLVVEPAHEDTGQPNAHREAFVTHSRRANALDPDDPAIRHLVGVGMANFRMAEEAQRSFRKALEINPDYAPALGSLGVSLMYVGRTEEAIALIERALRLSPREPQAYHWQSHLGLAFNIIGEPKRALEFAKAATERRATLMGRVALLMAHCQLGNTREADIIAHDLQNALPGFATAANLTRLMQQLVPDEDRREKMLQMVVPHLSATAPS